MQCYTELIPPSGVTQSLALPFISSTTNNLIVARTSLLQIFDVRSPAQGQDPKLILIAEYHLSGTVTALGRVHLEKSKSGGDAVLVAFRDAKLSLVEWDPVQHSICTISIHYYENHILQAAPWLPDLQYTVSHLTIDPESRCAAFNFGVSNLAIIPFHQTRDHLALDDDLDDSDVDIGDEQPVRTSNGASADHATPYFPSFVLPLTALDPGLLHPLDLTFLHEYRDPTVGVLYSTSARSHNLAFERKDVTIYSVYALDIEQRASTALQSVTNLPNDIHSVTALPLPVGGSLLIGGNELIHIDQGGKATGLAVNEFAKESSSFAMTDQSSHRMRLEGCQVIQLDRINGDMLIILKSGELVLLSFRLDGRSVSGLSLKRLENTEVFNAVKGMSSCVSALPSGQIFVGSEEADAVLLGAKRSAQLKRQLSRIHSNANWHAGEDGDEDEDDQENDDDDDLFAEANGSAHALPGGNGGPLHVLDTLPCIAPLHDIALGRATKRKRDDDDPEAETSPMAKGLEIAASYGRERAGGIAFFTQSVLPDVRKRLKIGNAQSIWTCCSNTEGDGRFIVSEKMENEELSSSLYELNDDSLVVVDGTEFESTTGAPIAVGTFQSTQRTIYVTGAEVRVYDADFGIAQILPIVEEDEGQLSRVTKARFAEPYIALVKDDRSVMILKADKNGELEELDLPSAISGDTFASADVFLDTSDFFQASRFHASGDEPSVILTLLSTSGSLSLAPLPNLDARVYQADGLSFLPVFLAPDVQLPKHWRNRDDLVDAVLASIGDADEHRPFLIVRNMTGDVIVYEPFAMPDVVGSFRLRKVTTRNADYNDDSTIPEDGEASQVIPPAVVFVTVSGHRGAYISGDKAWVILKQASSTLQVYPLGQADIVSLCSLRIGQSADDFAMITALGDVLLASLPVGLIVGQSPWVVHRQPLGNEVTSIAYFEETSSYAIASHRPTPFHLPRDDEFHSEWSNEKTNFLPTTSVSTLQLISSFTHNVISEYTFEDSERILDLKVMSLETSEITHRQQPLVVVGTGTAKGERIVTRGHIYLFSVAEVVPRPGVPESDLRLKLLSTEDVRGAVTTIAPIGSQGFVLAAQGQKCMVRGLREDMSILPVAFLDMRFYTSVSKSLPGTGLCILGDAFSGLWLIGYGEEPYKMQLLSQDLERPSVLAADFLPSEYSKELYIVSADGNGELRMLQYDPENPKAERGKKLLLRSTFNTGDAPTTMTLIPRTPTSYEAALTAPSAASSPASSDAMAVDTPPERPKSQLLLTHSSGAISLMTNLDEFSYRRLSTLQNILTSQLEHPCSLNPRAFRNVDTDGMGGRGVIDGDIARRWLGLSSQHKASVADKAGARAVWQIRGDLEAIMGGGMSFLA